MNKTACELCDGDGGVLIIQHEKWRIVRVAGDDGAAYRGFCRVIWNAHDAPFFTSNDEFAAVTIT